MTTPLPFTDPRILELGRALAGTASPANPAPVVSGELDGRLAEIEQMIDAQQRMGVPESDARLSSLSQGADALRALRQRIESGEVNLSPAQLRGAIADAMRQADSAVATGAASVAGDGRTARVMAFQTLQQAEQRMATYVAETEKNFNYFTGRAEALGIDTSSYEENYEEARRKAEELRKQGDRVGALIMDAKSTDITADMAEDIADASGDPKDRKRADQQRAVADAARKEAEAAARAEAQAKGAERELIGAEAEAVVELQVAARMAALDETDRAGEVRKDDDMYLASIAAPTSSIGADSIVIDGIRYDTALKTGAGEFSDVDAQAYIAQGDEGLAASTTALEAIGKGEVATKATVKAVSWGDVQLPQQDASGSAQPKALSERPSSATPISAPLDVAEAAPPLPLPHTTTSGGPARPI